MLSRNEYIKYKIIYAIICIIIMAKQTIHLANNFFNFFYLF